MQYDKIIKKHYNVMGKKWGSSSKSTMEDIIVRKFETQFINEVVKSLIHGKFQSIKKPRLLDVGCGNGYSLSVLKKKFKKISLFGIEPNSKLRKIAKSRSRKKGIRILKGDIRNRKILAIGKFDVIICQRVIINILNYSHQKKALENLKKLIKKGGILVIMEAFKDGLKNLNAAKREFNLPQNKPAHHNLYLKKNFFVTKNLKVWKPGSKIVEKYPLSKHYYISRVLHDLIIKMSRTKFKRNSKFVQFFSNSIKINFGNFAPLKFKILEKKK